MTATGYGLPGTVASSFAASSPATTSSRPRCWRSRLSKAADHAASLVSVTGGKSPVSGSVIGRHSVMRFATTSTHTARWFTSALREVELPRHTEAVVEPGKLAAEPVVTRRHQHRPAVRQGGERLVEFDLVGALDEQRGG